jgi:uncharacterized protein HemX
MNGALEPLPDAADPAPESPSVSAPASRRGRYLRLILVIGLLCVAVAAALAWLQRQQQSLLAAAEAERAALETRIATLTAKLDAAAADRANHDAALAALAARTDALAAVVTRLDEHAQSAAREATLAEVEELVVNAAERLRLGAEVSGAIAAVEAADRRIGELGEPALLPLREHLRHDLASLRAVPVPDVAAIALEFAEYAGRVDDLPLKVVDFSPEQPAEPQQPLAGGWRGLGARVWRDLADLVDVRRIPTPDLVLTDPQMRRLLVENVRMELATARYATLRRDGANMRASAGLARKLIGQYFDRDAASVGAALDGLARVQQVDLAPQLPTLDAAVGAIRAMRAEPALEPPYAP